MRNHKSKYFGGVILEISIGLACIIPIFVAVVIISEYMQATSNVREITAEVVRRFDLRLLRKTANIEATEVGINPQIVTDSTTFSRYAQNLGREVERFKKINGSKLSVNFMIKYVRVNTTTGEVNRDDLSRESTANSSDPATPRFAKGGNGDLYTAFLEEALDSIQASPRTPFPWAIPAGLRDVHQVSYLGASPIYSNGTPYQNDARSSNYFRFAPVVGVSVVLDLSETRTGRFIRNFSEYVTIFSSQHSQSFNLRDDVTLIHETQFIIPRNPGV